MKYYQLSKETIDKVTQNVKKSLNETFKRHQGEDWSDYSLASIEADIIYPILSTQFEKVTGEKNLDVLEQWSNDFLDDIYPSQEITDYTIKCLKKYHIYIEEEYMRGYAHKTPSKKHKKQPVKKCKFVCPENMF